MAPTPEKRLERLVCAEHCRYFKPWEELTRCSAYYWIAERVLGRPEFLELLERVRTSRVSLPLRHDAALARVLCTRCGYYPDGCAYRRRPGAADVVPCGAIVTAELLLNRGAIEEEQLFEVTNPGASVASA